MDHRSLLLPKQNNGSFISRSQPYVLVLGFIAIFFLGVYVGDHRRLQRETDVGIYENLDDATFATPKDWEEEQVGGTLANMKKKGNSFIKKTKSAGKAATNSHAYQQMKEDFKKAKAASKESAKKAGSKAKKAGSKMKVWKSDKDENVQLTIQVEGVTEENKDEVCASIAKSMGGSVRTCSLRNPEDKATVEMEQDGDNQAVSDNDLRRRLYDGILIVEIEDPDDKYAKGAMTLDDQFKFIRTLKDLPAWVSIGPIKSEVVDAELEIETDEEMAKKDPKTAKKFSVADKMVKWLLPEQTQNRPQDEVAAGPLALVGGCLTIMHCCMNERMQQTCGAKLYSLGVDMLEENPLFETEHKDIDPEIAPGLGDSKYFDLAESFCHTTTAFNLPSIADGFFFVINRGFKIAKKAINTFLNVFGPLGGWAKKIFMKVTGVGILGAAITGLLRCMEKVQIWKSMNSMRIATIAKNNEDGSLKKGDPVHLYANMNMMVSDKKNFNFVCRMAHSFRFGFIPGLMTPVSEMGVAFLWFRDYIMGTATAANYGPNLAANMTKAAVKDLRETSPDVSDPNYVGAVTTDSMFAKLGRFLRTVQDVTGKFLGPLAKPIKWVITKFYAMWTNIKSDPAVKAALNSIKSADMENLRNKPAPFIDNIVQALTNAIFDTPVYAMNNWCLSVAKNQKEKEQSSKLRKLAGGAMNFLDGASTNFRLDKDRRRLLDNEHEQHEDPLASTVLAQLDLGDYMSLENSIKLSNSYHEEYTANGNRHTDPDLEEELGVERPDLHWSAAHMYTQAHNEIHPEYNWRSPQLDEHAAAAHAYFQKYGDKHHGSDPDHFYAHNPQFER